MITVAKKPIGYQIECPKCGAEIWFSIDDCEGVCDKYINCPNCKTRIQTHYYTLSCMSKLKPEVTVIYEREDI